MESKMPCLFLVATLIIVLLLLAACKRQTQNDILDNIDEPLEVIAAEPVNNETDVLQTKNQTQQLTDLEKAKKESEKRISMQANWQPFLDIRKMEVILQDDDSNNLAEWLVFDVEYYSDVGGNVCVFANIYAENGDLICQGSLTTEERAQPLTWLCLDNYETASFRIYFSGLRIRMSKLDGPFTIELFISREMNDYQSVNLWYETDSLTYNIFQAALLSVVTVSDSLANQGKNIRFIITLNAEVAGNYTLSCTLYKVSEDNSAWLETLDRDVDLSAGYNQVLFDFDSKKIKGAGIGGPYSLTVYAKDRYYSSGYDHISANYQLSQLASPTAYLRAPIYSVDSGVNKISVFVPLTVTVAGTYYVYGSLWDSEFNLISVMNLQPILAVGTPDINLEFDTSQIAEYRLLGPYTVSVGILDQDDNSLVLENYPVQIE